MAYSMQYSLEYLGVVMSYDKILIVVLFLLALILVQLLIKYRGKVLLPSLPKTSSFTDMNIRARLPLSKSDRADVISVGKQSFLLVFAKGNSPSIIELSTENQQFENVSED